MQLREARVRHMGNSMADASPKALMYHRSCIPEGPHNYQSEPLKKFSCSLLVQPERGPWCILQGSWASSALWDPLSLREHLAQRKLRHNKCLKICILFKMMDIFWNCLHGNQFLKKKKSFFPVPWFSLLFF